MKKILTSLILTILIFSAMSPTIYGAQNTITNELKNSSIIEEIPEKETGDENLLQNEVITEENKVNEEMVAQELKETEIVEKTELTVSDHDYSGALFIDTPSNNQKCTYKETNNIEVSGWAVSNDSQASLKLYINDWLWAMIYDRTDRKDVDRIAANYGGSQNTPKSGFYKNLDISVLQPGKYTIKVEQVSRTGKVLSVQEKAIIIEEKAYTGALFIDTPTNNKKIVYKETNNIEISGWAVSNDSQASLKLYINNWLWAMIYDRTDRKDVDKIAANYGGSKNTPKAGFCKNLDISVLQPGKYTIKVEQVSRTGEVLSAQEKVIIIEEKAYTGALFIDTPSHNQVCELPDDNFIDITGWAVSNDSQASLKLYINDWLWAMIYDRTDRKDVDKIAANYGGSQNTPKSGFYKKLDISVLQPGQYTIKVEQVSRTGKVLNAAEKVILVNQKEYKGTMMLESDIEKTYKLPDVSSLNVSGWAVSNDANAYILVSVDGNLVNYKVERKSKNNIDNVLSNYGGVSNTPKAGFEITVDISKLKDGKHIIDIMQVSRFHKIVSRVQKTINISTPSYEGMICVDSPVSNRRYHSTKLKIEGWVLTENQGDYVEIYLDNKYISTADRVQRNDVLAVHGDKLGGAAANPKPGFLSEINISKLEEGKHKLKIVHYSSYGKLIQTAEVYFFTSNTLTWGIDVSHHQGIINWDAVKNQGVNFAILKIGEYRESTGKILMDQYFERNYTECKRLGIAVGGYFYSYAFNPAEAANEANACLAIINGKTFEMPIFFDLEDKLVTNAVKKGTTNRDNLTNATIMFCNILNQRGYQAGIYSYRDFFYDYLNMNALENYNIWLAHYASNTDYAGKYDMWQYTDKGSVQGINGDVDLNRCYKRFF